MKEPKYRYNQAAVTLLRNLPAYERKLEGWPAIRDWLKQLEICLPDGPSTWTMRRWRQREGFPVLRGLGRARPWTTTALVVAWLIQREIKLRK